MHTAFSSPSSAPAAPLMPVLMPFRSALSAARSDASVRPVPLDHLRPHQPGGFPETNLLGGKNVAWAQSEITAWMADRIAERNRGYDA
jgi:prophage regulatory protein